MACGVGSEWDGEEKEEREEMMGVEGGGEVGVAFAFLD